MRTASKERSILMSKIRLVLAVPLVVGLSTAALCAELPANVPVQEPGGETSLGILLDALRSNRKALVAVNLNLTDEQAAKFWPLYDRYQKEISAIGDRIVGVIQDYSASFNDLSNEKAMKLVEDYLSLEAERVKVKRAYLEKFAKVLPGRSVARFYQIENKIDAVLRYEMAATIPVVEQGSGTAAK
jgi:hypothetical protein